MNQWWVVGVFLAIVIFSSVIVVGCRSQSRNTTPALVTSTGGSSAATRQTTSTTRTPRPLAVKVLDDATFGEPSDSRQTPTRNQADPGDFRTLLTLLEVTDLYADLDGAEDYTLFAPTDEVFDQLSASQLTGLANDVDAARQLLRNHLVSTPLSAAELLDRGTVKTLGGTTLTITGSTNNLRVNGVAVSTADINADNGIIHVIDGYFSE